METVYNLFQFELGVKAAHVQQRTKPSVSASGGSCGPTDGSPSQRS